MNLCRDTTLPEKLSVIITTDNLSAHCWKTHIDLGGCFVFVGGVSEIDGFLPDLREMFHQSGPVRLV